MSGDSTSKPSEKPAADNGSTSNLPLTPEAFEQAPDRLKKAQLRIESYSHDTEAWGAFIRDAQKKTIHVARPIYEKLVEHFPNCGKYWKLYIEHELKAVCFDKVEKLFQRCLIHVLNIDLWRLYLLYIKETKGKLPDFREKMAQAYDFALDKVGQDYMSLPIWQEYVTFLKGVEAVGSYAENQRIMAVRRLYQKGIVTPMYNIEHLWKDYCTYEQGINMSLAKKLIDERSRDYMNSRRVSKEYETLCKGLNRNKPSEPPSTAAEELRQVALWKRYIAFEKGNPLRSEDHNVITRRVLFAYEQCLLCLGYYPDMWIEAASYLEYWSRRVLEKGDPLAGKTLADLAAKLYERATTGLLKNNMLIHFAYADFEEGRMKPDKVHTIYKKFAKLPDLDPTLCYIQYMRFARRATGLKEAREVFKVARADPRSTYHVFVAAALMEYSSSKDKKISFNIFELGMKKYGGNPDYLVAYIDYMSRLNEDNNTRVAFERILKPGQLSPENSPEIWRRFMEFEAEVGDLQSIQKVERRRSAAVQQLKEYEGREHSLLVDKYKFLDLYPGTMTELRAIGYKDKSRLGLSLSSSADKPGNQEPEAGQGRKGAKEIAVPDINQMIPFKPRMMPPTGAHPIQGGVFPPPPAASHLLTLLPPPQCFQGPFVKVEGLLDQLANLDLEKLFGPDSSLLPHGGDTATFNNDRTESGGLKRKAATNGEEGAGEGDSGKPPSGDLYRKRQQKRAK